MADKELVFPDEAKSPVENLPVGAGKKRRGRPKKVRVAESGSVPAVNPVADGSAQPADISDVVTAAIGKALKKGKPPGPETRKGITGLVKQVTRSEVQRAVRNELKTRQADVGIAEEVRETITAADSSDALATQHGQDHRFWHLLRAR